MTLMLDTLPQLPRLPASQVQAARPSVWIDVERGSDAEARERLLDGAFGAERFGKTCERLRSGRLPARGLSLVARVRGGAIVGTVRLWHVDAGGVPALMLGPLAVDAAWRRDGIGARLMEAAITRATALGHRAILLIGDAPYYARFGFSRIVTTELRMPGPIEDERFLGLDLAPGGFDGAKGLVRATGAVDLGRRRARTRARLRPAA